MFRGADALVTEDQKALASFTIARYRMRALMAASSIGLLVGASFGAACLGGHLAKDSNAHEDARRLTQIALFSKNAPAKGTPAAEIVAEAYDTATVTGEIRPEMNPTAMMIALRYAPYGSEPTSNSLVAQNLTAMRTSFDVRAQKAMLQTAAEGDNVHTGLLASTKILSDHPVAPMVRPAPAFAFKAHTTNDSDCLAQAVYYEARGEGEDGMRAVAQVILNRVRHPAFPKTICGVVYQGAMQQTGCQFSFACDGALARPVEDWAWRRAKSVAQAALSGYVMKAVGSATHFHTLAVDPRWSANMVKIATVGGHTFYQFQGRSALIRSADGVQPSTDVPDAVVLKSGEMLQYTSASASTTPVVKTAETGGEITPAPSIKPVALAAKTSGKSAQEIIAAVALPQPATETPVAAVAPSPSRPSITPPKPPRNGALSALD